MNEFAKVMDSVEYIKKTSSIKPEVGIILGTGLDKLAEKIRTEAVIPYKEIPHFPVSTVKSHTGNLVLGELSGKRVVAMQGRFHCYEGYSATQIALPIRVMKFLGIDTLIESNASGGMNPLFSKGDLVIISDHINLMPYNPLVGYNEERFGPRFPDMSRVYDNDLIMKAESVALELKIPVKKGVLAGLIGPNLETRAEYRFLRLIGADMVCMSTIPEAITAIHLGLKVFGVSVITDMCLPEALKPVSLDEMIEIASKAEPKLTGLIEKFIMTV